VGSFQDQKAIAGRTIFNVIVSCCREPLLVSNCLTDEIVSRATIVTSGISEKVKVSWDRRFMLSPGIERFE
jgi:hypothetical protein